MSAPRYATSTAVRHVRPGTRRPPRHAACTASTAVRRQEPAAACWQRGATPRWQRRESCHPDALAACGHGGKVLLADANYSHSTNASPRAALVYLNVRPGLVTVDQVLEPVLAAVPVEAVHVMQPDEGPEPDVFATYRAQLGPELPLRPMGRLQFYAACREPDLAVCVATGDGRLYANILLTVGYIAPPA